MVDEESPSLSDPVGSGEGHRARVTPSSGGGGGDGGSNGNGGGSGARGGHHKRHRQNNHDHHDRSQPHRQHRHHDRQYPHQQQHPKDRQECGPRDGSAGRGVGRGGRGRSRSAKRSDVGGRAGNGGENNRSDGGASNRGNRGAEDPIIVAEPEPSSTWREVLRPSGGATSSAVDGDDAASGGDAAVSPTLVISYDLENALGSALGEIWQLGAVCGLPLTDGDAAAAAKEEVGALRSDAHRFLANLLPEGGIHFGVTKYSGTNVRVLRDPESGERYLFQTQKKIRLESVDAGAGLAAFLNWIEERKDDAERELSRKNGDGGGDAVGTVRVVLASHGNLDTPNLLNNLAHHRGLLDRFRSLVAGFADSQPYLNVGLSAAFERLFPGEPFEAHDALEDAEALFRVLARKKLPRPSPSSSFSRSSAPASPQTTGRMLLHFDPPQLGRSFLSTHDAVELTKFQVLRLQQKYSPSDRGVKAIAALSMEMVVSDLAKYKFVTASQRQQEKGPGVEGRLYPADGGRPRVADWPPVSRSLFSATAEEHCGEGGTKVAKPGHVSTTETASDDNVLCVAFDVQFLHSQGLRSDLVRISGLVHHHGGGVDDDDSSGGGEEKAFDSACVPPCEAHLHQPGVDRYAANALDAFLDWLGELKNDLLSAVGPEATGGGANLRLVLFGHGILHRKWPGLVNHLDHSGRLDRFVSLVDGVCDIAPLMKGDPQKKKNISKDTGNANAVRVISEGAGVSGKATGGGGKDGRSTGGATKNASSVTRATNVLERAQGQEKVHRSHFPRDPPLQIHRSLNVCRSSSRLFSELVRKRQPEHRGRKEDPTADVRSGAADAERKLIRSNAVTCRYARRLAKYLVDQSTAADIAAGVDFEPGAYEGHRMSPQT